MSIRKKFVDLPDVMLMDSPFSYIDGMRHILGKIRKWLIRDPATSLAPKHTLGVLAIMKNETCALREWVDHYRWQGADLIVLIDNGSTDSPRELIREEISSGLVEIYERSSPHRQVPHYRDVFRAARLRKRVEWLAIADIDEFWYSPLGDLKAAIQTLGNTIDLVYSNWIMFGSSGKIEQPKSVREGFVHRWPELTSHNETKWIARTFALRSSRQLEIHKVSGVDSRRVVSDNRVFRLAHYPIQSRNYFETVKMRRGDASNPKFDQGRNWEYFNTYDAPATVLDETLAEMVRITRQHQNEQG